jgi:hypothetical protein
MAAEAACLSGGLRDIAIDQLNAGRVANITPNPDTSSRNRTPQDSHFRAKTRNNKDLASVVLGTCLPYMVRVPIPG